jgi:spore maturation protein CgeB
MKILFSGHHNPHFFTITEYLERAIRSLGHELFIFEDRKHVIPGRVRKHLPFLNSLDYKIINQTLLSLAADTGPDIAIVTGGNRISSGTIEMLKNIGITCILWTTDPPLHSQRIIKAAPFYNHIFCQGTEWVELLEQTGIKDAQWLPMACDPDCHHSIDCSAADREKYGNDIVFVGSYYPSRVRLFEKISDFDLAIWGPGWENLDPNSPLRRCLRGAHTTPDEWLKVYSASKIILAVHYHDPQNRFPVYQASPRVFEAMACGSFVLCDQQRDVLALFKDGADLVSFSDSDDLISKISHYLTHTGERDRIAGQGKRTVLEHHTYVHRVKSLLSHIGCEP